MKLNRREITTVAGISLAGVVGYLWWGDDEDGETSKNGGGETGADSTGGNGDGDGTGTGGSDSGDGSDGTGDGDGDDTENSDGDIDGDDSEGGGDGDADDEDEDEDEDDEPDDTQGLLERHQAALDDSGSYTADLDAENTTYSRDDQWTTRHDGILTYEVSADIGLFEEDRYSDGDHSGMHGEYTNHETTYVRSAFTGDVREDDSAHVPYEHARNVEYDVNGHGFSLANDDVEFENVGDTMYNGQSVTEYTLTDHNEDYSEFEATLFINDDGIIIYAEWDYYYPYDSAEEYDTEGSIALSNIGSTQVSEPDWYDEEEHE